jgi:hypothetical protein
MSLTYPGGFITKNPTAATNTAATGIWTIDQATQNIKAGTWPYPYTPIYVEDVFSTYIYTGNGTGKTIKNDIKLGASYSGTTLKLNFDSNNTDSANSFTPTVTGTAGYSTADAKFGAGSCAGFNSASWLEYNPDAGNFGSGDWTVEFWVKTSSGNGPGIVTQSFAAGAGATSWGFFVGYGTSGNVALYLSDGSTYFASITSGTTAVNNNTWNHVAACRSGSTVYLFLNGVSQGTVSVGTTALGNGGAPVRIGGQGTSYAMPSGTYIDDVRIIKGTALYTSGFTPPSSATNTTSYPPTTEAGNGGLVWIRERQSLSAHCLFDTERGTGTVLSTNSAGGQVTTDALTSFNSNGFSVKYPNTNDYYVNRGNQLTASWTFRQKSKFFDIVTYSGNSVDNRVINHNLESTPGCIIIQRRSGDDWFVYHRSLSANYGLRLNKTDAEQSNTATVKSVSSTSFTVGTDGMVNVSGSDYVAYIFAHDAGGFGLTGSDNIITCGSLTTNGSGEATVTLGYEPQWLLLKQSSTTGNWLMVDNMRGWNVQSSGNIQRLFSNLNNAESSGGQLNPTATGFKTSGSGSLAASTTYVYIAIRRGPMKTPTSGTQVFSPFYVNQSAGTQNTTNFPVDAMIIRSPGAGENNHLVSRLTGVSSDTTDSGYYLYTQAIDAEGSGGITRGWDNIGFQSTSGYSGYTAIYLPLRRAPGFFDEVCWTGTGSNIDVTHNLKVTPEFIIGKARDYTSGWICYHKDLGSTGGYPNYIILNSTNAVGPGGSTIWRGVSSTTFSYGTNSTLNFSGLNYVAYLFASVPGVSKVGSYTGNGSSQTIDCGFTNGARFVLIRRIDVSEDWYVFDSARGIVSGNDPFFYLNSTAAQGTSQDIIDPDNSGFIVNAVAGQNTNGGTYIYLAIA